jgi:hypothetical protein
MKYLKCLGHKETDMVALVMRDNVKMIIKAKLDLSQTIRLHFNDMSIMNRLDSQYYYNTSGLMNILTNVYNHSQYLTERILVECDNGWDGRLTYREAMYCWHMIDQDELIIMLKVEHLEVVPHFYGACGALIVMEYASTIPLTLPVVHDVRDWSFRAKLAIGLIELTERLQQTQFGTLYLCDFKETNFGVVQVDNSFVVKSIDNDLSLFENTLHMVIKTEMNKDCIYDDECDYVNCLVRCNQTTKKCSGKLSSNNLQVFYILYIKQGNPHRLAYSGTSLNGQP